MLRVGRAGLVIYLTVLLVLMLLENKMIYFPAKYPIGNWEPVDLPVEDAHFTATDGTQLHGWFHEHPHPRGYALFAHGNAGNITGRAELLRVWADRLRVSMLVFDYRGYGRSSGSPSEIGIIQDARAARSWLAQRAGIEESNVILVGRSLGGAVVVDLAASDGARALILESTFTSMPELAAVHYPWLPVRRFMRTRLNSLDIIGDYDGPVLISHGDADQIVPFELGRELYEAVLSQMKQFLTIDGGDHNDPQPGWYYDQLDAFLDRLDHDGRL